jgi:GT2 family glycosyltransferase
MSSVRIEIVTPVHNRIEETILCLNSLARVDRTGLDIHIIIVDDGSTDGTAQTVAAKYPEVEIISGDGSLWYTAGTNRGLEAALRNDPHYILAINNDSIFDSDCIQRLVACAQKDPRSVVGPVLLDRSLPHKVFQVGPRWELWRGGYRHWFRQTVWTLPKAPFEVELIVGNCVLYPAKAVREAGLMDERRLPQFGDVEYTPRMRRLGWRLLIEPRARVFCKPNDVIKGFRKLGLSEKIDHLFVNKMSPYSFWRRLYGNLGGAPGRVQGLLSVPLYYARLLAGISGDGQWALSQKEEPLSEIYSSTVESEENKAS